MKSLTLPKPLLAQLTTFAVLLTIAIVAPLFHFQPITGTIVNATLFLGAMLLPIEYALMLGLLPSLMALSAGTLPAILAPMVPFIMASNTILVVSFAFLRQKNYFLATIFASILKFLFLFSTSYIVIHLITQQPIAQKAAMMMSWPQLATALLGGIIAFIFLKLIRSKQQKML